MVEVDTSHLKPLGPAMPKVMQRGMELAGQDMLNVLQRTTPRDHGWLASWTIKEKSQTHVLIQSPAAYGRWVNDGHSQQPGRFIPGSWQGDKFRYNPKAKTGMVLKKSHVSGKHFVERSIAQVRPRLDDHFKVAISEVLG